MDDRDAALETQTILGGFRSYPSSVAILTDRPSASDVRFAADLMTSLGHPTRVGIVNLLRKEPLSVGSIASGLNISQANASQHLAILLRSGILARTSSGTTRRYSLRNPNLGKMLDLIEAFRRAHLDDPSPMDTDGEDD
ncbi:MAG TPA: metalloregulator ArsR/SmtB family transcription factor [Fimbriimonadales bacterium]|nr:metalloregulator ArsR/SmtB family transcription factor [Fimbriimonadales bacterium]